MRMESPLNQRLRRSPPDVVYTPIDVTSNRTVEENSKPGTIEWQLQFTSFDDPVTLAAMPTIRRLRSIAIEGYASEMSVLPGESIDFMVSMDPPGRFLRFLIDVYRMGYYGARAAVTWRASVPSSPSHSRCR